MIQRFFLPASFLSAAAALAFACSSSSNNNPADGGTPDSGTSPDSAGNGNPDSSQPSPDSSADSAGNLDGSTGPQGTQLVASSTVTIDGVTSDGFVVYTDTSAHTISAIPLAGGATTPIGTVDSNNDVLVVGALVLFQTSATAAAGTGPMSAWKSGGTATAISTTSLLVRGLFAVSSDDSSILLFDDIDAKTLVADLVVEHVDGTARSTVVSGLDLQSVTCQPSLVFGGTTAFAAYCPPVSPDAGTEDAGTGSGTAVATVTAWAVSGTTWTPTASVTNVQPYVVTDSTGTSFLVQTPTGLAVYGANGSGPTPIDATGTTGVFTSNGQSVLFVTSTNTLDRSTIASPSPVTIAAKDFAFMVAGSPDGNWMLGGLTAGQGGSDLYLSSTSATGAPHTPLALSLAATAQAGTLYGDAFTTDSSNALYFTNTAASSGAGTLNVIPTGGGTPVVLSSNNALFDLATSGTNVVFGDNLTGGGGQRSRLDLELVDVSTPTAVTLVVSQADASFFVSSDKKNLAYSWSASPGSQAGVWVLPLQ